MRVDAVSLLESEFARAGAAVMGWERPATSNGQRGERSERIAEGRIADDRSNGCKKGNKNVPFRMCEGVGGCVPLVARAAGARPPRAATVARGVVATANMLAGVVMTTRGARIRCLIST
jgi:hypothetical protein